MPPTITLVLPVDAVEATTSVRLAPGVEDFAGAPVGVVDNGLWGAMRTFAGVWRDDAASRRASELRVTPFDHLAIDFPEQQRALVPFSAQVRAAVAGLGN
jgi:hypothetical protein